MLFYQRVPKKIVDAMGCLPMKWDIMGHPHSQAIQWDCGGAMAMPWVATVNRS